MRCNGIEGIGAAIFPLLPNFTEVGQRVTSIKHNVIESFGTSLILDSASCIEATHLRNSEQALRHLRMNRKVLTPFVVSPSATLRRALSNHVWNQLVQSFLELFVAQQAIPR